MIARYVAMLFVVSVIYCGSSMRPDRVCGSDRYAGIERGVVVSSRTIDRGELVDRNLVSEARPRGTCRLRPGLVKRVSRVVRFKGSCSCLVFYVL